MFVMVALLIHSPLTYGKLTFACLRSALQTAIVLVAFWRHFRLSAVWNVRLLLKYPKLLLMGLRALHALLLQNRFRLAPTLEVGIVRMVTVVLSSAAGYTGVSPAFGVGGLLIPRL